jgi:hypothetical protein
LPDLRDFNTNQLWLILSRDGELWAFFTFLAALAVLSGDGEQIHFMARFDESCQIVPSG